MMMTEPSATRFSQMIVIGEAAKAVTQADPELADSLSEIEWSPLAKMRDRLTYQYWTTDREIVWSTAMVDIPEVRKSVHGALERLG